VEDIDRPPDIAQMQLTPKRSSLDFAAHMDYFKKAVILTKSIGSGPDLFGSDGRVVPENSKRKSRKPIDKRMKVWYNKRLGFGWSGHTALKKD
jgi:hypothetical protein